MSKTNYLNMRINGWLKDEFWKFCDGIGMNASAVITLLAKKCVAEGNIPFEVVSPENALQMRAGTATVGGGYSDVRVSFRMDCSLREQFSSVCNNSIGIGMSVVVKAFMVQCIDKGRLPF